jgi:hypothetical protein
MLTILFLSFATVMVVLVVALCAHYLGGRTAIGIATALATWLLYVGCIGYFGVIRNFTMRPPGAVFLFGPVVAFLVFFILRMRSESGLRVALAFPLSLLLGMQVFRVIVELFLHELWHVGLIPRMLTYAGANVDIYVGASAPIVAWLATRLRWGTRLALIWNVLGLLALANVVSRAILTTPGPFHFIPSEVPDLMIGTFPYMFIPGFMVPLAVVLHVIALRAITSPKRHERP